MPGKKVVLAGDRDSRIRSFVAVARWQNSKDLRAASPSALHGTARTLDGPGRSRGRGPGLLTPAGMESSYHLRRASSRV